MRRLPLTRGPGELIASDTVSLVLTDPPYGVSIVRPARGHTKGHIGSQAKYYSPVIGDQSTDTARAHWKLVADMKCHAVIWGGNYMTDFLPPSPCWIVWDKREDMVSNDFADCELAWSNYDTPARIYRQKMEWYGSHRAAVKRS